MCGLLYGTKPTFTSVTALKNPMSLDLGTSLMLEFCHLIQFNNI